MRLASLGSGSKGNATLVESGDVRLLIDCGFTLAETEKRLRRLDVDPQSLTAILVTHEHADHSNGVGPLARRYDLPVLMSRGSRDSGRCGTIRALQIVSAEQPVAFQSLRVFPFSVPHDAREPLQFAFEAENKRLVVLTDLGCSSQHVIEQLQCCDVVMLECNHDESMLWQGRYPPSLKKRVGGQFGHLSNTQAAEILAAAKSERLHTVIAAHLSEENNHPSLATSALATVMGWPTTAIKVATQEHGLHWITC
jgi:phosphoribosyl 1,2-cyclic phosphodiesterase